MLGSAAFRCTLLRTLQTTPASLVVLCQLSIQLGRVFLHLGTHAPLANGTQVVKVTPYALQLRAHLKQLPLVTMRESWVLVNGCCESRQIITR